ncbi:MAG: winged helix-turn-helix transcriptional regulator [Methanobrevibacter sp.]|nr:winged helix-turn-helix transcriptional regulator [Methanobrevibacter sp.]
MTVTNNIHYLSNIEDKELFNLVMGNKGGRTRMRILDALLIMPSNANQLAKKLKLDYKTVTYHMNIICKHKYATREKFEKYTRYYPSDKLIKNLKEYKIIKQHIQNEI